MFDHNFWLKTAFIEIYLARARHESSYLILVGDEGFLRFHNLLIDTAIASSSTLPWLFTEPVIQTLGLAISTRISVVVKSTISHTI
jgi:hypothetical protein